MASKKHFDKKGWPLLNDLELPDILKLTLCKGKMEYLLSDPVYIVSYYFNETMCIAFPSWRAERRYDKKFFSALRKWTKDEINHPDDVCVLQEKNSKDLYYKIGDVEVVCPYDGYDEYFGVFRKWLKLQYDHERLVDQFIIPTWHKRLSGVRPNKPTQLVKGPLHPDLKVSYEANLRILKDIMVLLEDSGEKKFKVRWSHSEKVLQVDVAGVRIMIRSGDI